METTSDNLSAEQRAAKIRADKQKQENMLMIRKQYREATIDRQRPPDWLVLLQARKLAVAAEEGTVIEASTWFRNLQKQQSIVQDGPGGAGDFSSGWLRLVDSEEAGTDSSTGNTSSL